SRKIHDAMPAVRRREHFPPDISDAAAIPTRTLGDQPVGQQPAIVWGPVDSGGTRRGLRRQPAQATACRDKQPLRSLMGADASATQADGQGMELGKTFSQPGWGAIGCRVLPRIPEMQDLVDHERIQLPAKLLALAAPTLSTEDQEQHLPAAPPTPAGAVRARIVEYVDQRTLVGQRPVHRGCMTEGRVR